MDPLEAAKAALAKAELAYTAAVQAAAQTNQWSLVHAARQAVDQARAGIQALLQAAGLS